MSPIIRQLTLPVGHIVMYVSEQLKGQYRNQASGGNCNALAGKVKGLGVRDVRPSATNAL